MGWRVRACWLFGSCGQARRIVRCCCLRCIVASCCCCCFVVCSFMLTFCFYLISTSSTRRHTKLPNAFALNVTTTKTATATATTTAATTTGNPTAADVVVVVVTFVEITSAKRASLWELFWSCFAVGPSRSAPQTLPRMHSRSRSLSSTPSLSVVRLCVVCLVCSLGHFTCCL